MKRPALSFALLALLSVSSLVVVGCGSDGDTTSETTPADAAAADGAAADGAAADAGGSSPDGAAVDASKKTNTLLADGEYFVGVKLSLAGAQLRMKVALTAEGEASKGGKLLTFDLYGLGSADDWVSPAPIATAKDVVVKADGTFSVDLGKVTVPAKSSPTGTPVESNMVVIGTVDSKASTFCGSFSGNIPAFEADLKGTTFKAVPFGTQADPYEVGCSINTVTYTPIDKCPKLEVGLNKIKSAGFDRTFLLYLPAAATKTASTGHPVVVLYHGNTGSAAGIVKSTGWREIQKGETADPFILIAPDTSALVGDKKPVLDWRYGEKVFDYDNRELVMFDDMLKCVGEQHKIDEKRVYVTGMSAGGMMTTFLSAHRTAKLAATAPFSGGYLHKWPSEGPKTPMLVIWGGEKDFAYSQNFHTLAQTLMKSLTDNKWWFARCNHGTGHNIPVSLVKNAWTFLKGHRLGEASPFAKGLPSDFPSFCDLPQK